MSRAASYISSTTSFILTIVFILSIRWALFEPYVIPSGSMIPSLLIHDHILVKKFSYGLRVPFTDNWLYGPKTPTRGSIVVFKHPNNDYFMVKRVIGLPGDTIVMDKNGQLKINDVPVEFKLSKADAENFYAVTEHDLQADPEDIDIYTNQINKIGFRTILRKDRRREAQVYEVPSKHIFMMGDNRDNSSDSRFWGALPLKLVMGEASNVWLSCDETFEAVPALCNPTKLRWSRFFHSVN